MQLPGKNFLKKAFLVAAAGVGLTGCAVVPYGHHGHVGVGVYVPPPVVVTPVYPVYPVYRAPVIVVPNHHHHGGWHHGGHGHRR
jgi:hypothetical protein